MSPSHGWWSHLAAQCPGHPKQSPGMGHVRWATRKSPWVLLSKPGRPPSWEDAEKVDIGRGWGGRAKLIGSKQGRSPFTKSRLTPHRAHGLTTPALVWVSVSCCRQALPGAGDGGDLGGILPSAFSSYSPSLALGIRYRGRTLFVGTHDAGGGVVWDGRTPEPLCGEEGSSQRQWC